MITQDELTSELAHLRRKPGENTDGTDARPEPAPEPAPEPTAHIDLADILARHGLDISDPAGLMQQLTKELGDLARDKPLASAATAFGLGFALGRMSKQST